MTEQIERELSHNTHLSEKLLHTLPEEKLAAYFNRSTDPCATFLMNWTGPVMFIAGVSAPFVGLETGAESLLSKALIAAGLAVWGTGIFRHVREAGLTEEISWDCAARQIPAVDSDGSCEGVPRRGSANPAASCAPCKDLPCATSLGDGSSPQVDDKMPADHPQTGWMSGERPDPNDAAEDKRPPKIGTRMRDGTVYAGLSPDTGKAMYAMPADAPLTYTFNQAQKYAAKLDAHSHNDWRAPTKGELNMLFQNRAAIGRFDESGSNPAGWYWSSSEDIDYGAWGQRFSDGFQKGYDCKDYDSSLRCVR
jgi:hypothetical protein